MSHAFFRGCGATPAEHPTSSPAGAVEPALQACAFRDWVPPFKPARYLLNSVQRHNPRRGTKGVNPVMRPNSECTDLRDFMTGKTTTDMSRFLKVYSRDSRWCLRPELPPETAAERSTCDESHDVLKPSTQGEKTNAPRVKCHKRLSVLG